ncbi:MAG: hypothetical protein IIW17_06610, partial [Clostridia bacterium]|nr:hypothetical protein [Clostridia bacterium]
DYALGLRISREYRIGRIYDVLYCCRRWEGNSDAALDIEYEQFSDALVVGQLQVLLEREQGLPPKECRILVQWGEDGGVREVTLFLSGKAIWRDPDPLCAYVEELLDCECKVVLE